MLTDAGRALLVEAAPVHVEGVRTHLLDTMSPAEFEQLGEIMERVATKLRQDS